MKRIGKKKFKMILIYLFFCYLAYLLAFFYDVIFVYFIFYIILKLICYRKWIFKLLLGSQVWYLVILGHVYDGLLLHPDNEHIVYPLGSTVVIRHILSRTQTFLRGHDNKVSSNNNINIAIKISRDGHYIISAQTSFPGFAADVIIWDFKTR